MRLLPQTIAIIAALLLFSFGIAVVTRFAFELPKLRELQAQSDRKDLHRVLLAIEAKQLQLSALVYKDAIADSMFDYMANRDSQYLTDKFPIDTLATLNINVVALFDRQNHLIEHRLIDKGQGTFTDQKLQPQAFLPFLPNLDNVHPHAPIFNSGVVQTERGLMLYAASSIMRGDIISETRGNLLFATAIDDEFIHEIEEAAQVHMAIAAIDPSSNAAAPLSSNHRNSHDQLFWLLTDNNKKPVAQLIVTLPPLNGDTNFWTLSLLVALIGNLGGSVIMLILFRRLVIKPILGIGQHSQRVRTDYSLRLDSNLPNELGDLSRNIDDLVAHVKMQHAQLQTQAAELEALSYRDGLTGIANRRRFDQALADNWALAQRAHIPVALILCDIDFFKEYNDHYGHQCGDTALRSVAQIIERVTGRQSDLAARYGGEEFVVLLPNTTEESAQYFAERLQNEIRAAALPHEYSTTSTLLTLSMGIASLIPEGEQTAYDLISQADHALYAAKAKGRNSIKCASQQRYELSCSDEIVG